MAIWIGQVPYDAETKSWLQATDHYLGNAPPGCLFAVGVRALRPVLFHDIPVADGPPLGICLISRPIARMLPQDGSVGEVTRLWLSVGLPYGTASLVLRRATELATRRGMTALISYHDRSRHSGCIYRKAGFRKDGVTAPALSAGWGSRARSASACAAGKTSKRRWRLDLLRTTGPL